MMKAVITEHGAKRYGLQEGTIIQFEFVNRFGCAVNPTISEDSRTDHGKLMPRHVSIDQFCDEEEYGARYVE